MTRFEFALLLLAAACLAWLQDTLWVSFVLGEARFVSPFFMGALPAFVSLFYCAVLIYLSGVLLYRIFRHNDWDRVKGWRVLFFLYLYLYAGAFVIGILYFSSYPILAWLIAHLKGVPRELSEIAFEYWGAFDVHEFWVLSSVSLLASSVRFSIDLLRSYYASEDVDHMRINI